jgi:hypothetical protein
LGIKVTFDFGGTTKNKQVCVDLAYCALAFIVLLAFDVRVQLGESMYSLSLPIMHWRSDFEVTSVLCEPFLLSFLTFSPAD